MTEKNKKTRKFTNLGLGLFVHYGIYSVLEQGEWIKLGNDISDDEYDLLAKDFHPCENFANNLCEFAIENGFKYIVLTTRHHDGFSLYDTKGLNPFDAKHYLNRDLVEEFVNACNEHGLTPILYHTLIDWREEKKYSSFSEYLSYLRKSIDILCSNYGPIGGIWFDGQWKYPKADWEEDKLYGLIHEKQPNALIINNAGLSRLGERFSKDIDVVTYERNNISNYNYDETIDCYAAEMCQALNSHWGYAKDDIDYKSVKEILYNFCSCRKYGGNFLLNIGPEPDGSIRSIEKDIIQLFGNWVKQNKEAMYLPKPFQMNLPNNVYALKDGRYLYLVIKDIPMEIDENAGSYNKTPTIIDLSSLNIEKAVWLDDETEINFTEQRLEVPPFNYGRSWLVRILKITLK